MANVTVIKEAFFSNDYDAKFLSENRLLNLVDKPLTIRASEVNFFLKSNELFFFWYSTNLFADI